MLYCAINCGPLGTSAVLLSKLVERIVFVVDAGLFDTLGKVERQPRAAEDADRCRDVSGSRPGKRAVSRHAKYRVVLDATTQGIEQPVPQPALDLQSCS